MAAVDWAGSHAVSCRSLATAGVGQCARYMPAHGTQSDGCLAMTAGISVCGAPIMWAETSAFGLVSLSLTISW